MKLPTVAIFFDKRRIKEGHASVKLSVYYNAKQKQFSTGLILTDEQIEFLNKHKSGLTGKVRDESLRNLWNKIYGREYFDELTGDKKDSWLRRAQIAISKIEHRFSFEEFQALLLTERHDPAVFPNDLIVALRDQEKLLSDQENYTRATIFRSAANSIERFVTDTGITNKSNPKVPFFLVNKDFLKRYEKYLLDNGGFRPLTKTRRPVGQTTVSFYMSGIKKVVNEAIKAKILPKEDYPFGGEGYRIPKGKNTKKALPSDVISAVLGYSSKFTRRNYAMDVWKFSYFCGGMNMADLARLKWRNVDLINNQVSFIRRKTRTTKENAGQETVISLMPEALEIIRKWGRPNEDQDDFIFPELSLGMNEKQIHLAIYSLTRRVNRMLVVILKELGIQAKIRTYEARHSYATTLARAQVPLAFISQGLGHSSLATTERYLGSFEYEQTQQFLSALIPKKQESQEL
ncbi:integrase [Dyadobacter sp. BE34]|uniref:Integrase n=1 Tax=Dyadobacter fermentans TaxID=94254 RepID=A0ABU1QWQ0_9BACT|nr:MULTISPECIES: site-specific integrase [Dyadobacter]MDR6805586.1 integrase [Dyadobacter fermentans]MDR7042654.1 integrase [Dyadobacter sp. BE242]MDR7196966.1 integrase [Dyadobacter sp. BE34]MDR7215599.1 integrase [Dyadobacter sp. BE31]MDR7263135.1 integrase [Dyadobacter sp. BE32]